MRVIGIDPGKDTGIAFFRHRELSVIETFNVLSAIKVIEKFDSDDIVIMEDSRLQSTNFRDRGANNKPVTFSIGRKVGRVDQICALYEEVCLDKGIKLILLSPKEKGGKLTHDEFVKKTKWNKSSNQHERDAAMLAYPFRNGVRL